MVDQNNPKSRLQFIEYGMGNGSSVSLAIDAKPGPYEAEIQRQGMVTGNATLIAAFLRGEGTLVDVGANIGTIAVPIAKLGSHVYGIEMIPSNVQKLLASKLENGLSHLKIMQAAASDRESIVHYIGNEAWGTIVETGSEAASYRLDTLYDLLRLSDQNFLVEPVFLKIDVEGHEPQVIRGATRFIEETRPHVLFECIAFAGEQGKAATESKALLAEMNYHLFIVRHNIFSERSHKELQEGLVCDFLAIPAEKIDRKEADFPEYDFRALSLNEIMDWLREDITHGAQVHALHTLEYVKNAASESTGMEDFRPIVEELAKRDDPKIMELAQELLISANPSWSQAV